jgi:hypothetical protein
VVLSILALLLFAGTAVAAWPTGAQGDQYNAVNAAMETAVAGVGISPDTFISIYNSAVAGETAGFTDTQLTATCQVLSELTSYESVLDDYNTVYNNLGCSTRLASAGPSRSALPSTGIALALLAGSGVIGVGAASRLIKKSR